MDSSVSPIVFILLFLLLLQLFNEPQLKYIYAKLEYCTPEPRTKQIYWRCTPQHADSTDSIPH
jgi:hypothetical protein